MCAEWKARPENVYNCRCTVVANVIGINGVKISDRAKKADRVTVQDWWKKERAKDPKEFDIRQKMLYNETDKEQLAKYKKRLHGDAPGSLAKFQNIKYREPGKYAELKEYYRYRGVAPDSDKRFFYANKVKDELYARGEIRTTGILVSPSTKYTIIDVNDHARSRLEERGITKQWAQEIVDKADFSIRQRNGTQYAYYNANGMVVVDNSGILGTAGKLDEGGRKLYKEVMKYAGK